MPLINAFVVDFTTNATLNAELLKYKIKNLKAKVVHYIFNLLKLKKYKNKIV